jgi:hypothetical protein
LLTPERKKRITAEQALMYPFLRPRKAKHKTRKPKGASLDAPIST